MADLSKWLRSIPDLKQHAELFERADVTSLAALHEIHSDEPLIELGMCLLFIRFVLIL